MGLEAKGGRKEDGGELALRGRGRDCAWVRLASERNIRHLVRQRTTPIRRSQGTSASDEMDVVYANSMTKRPEGREVRVSPALSGGGGTRGRDRPSSSAHLGCLVVPVRDPPRG